MADDGRDNQEVGEKQLNQSRWTWCTRAKNKEGKVKLYAQNSEHNGVVWNRHGVIRQLLKARVCILYKPGLFDEVIAHSTNQRAGIEDFSV